MATYHTEHTFTGGQPMAAWNPVTRRHESKPNPNFCAVCGRKEDHILHGAGKAIVSYGLPSHSVNPMLKPVN